MGFQQKLPGRCACASGVSTFGLRVCCPASGSVLSLPHSGAVSGHFSIVLRNCTGRVQKSFLRPILARFQPGGCRKFQHRPSVQIKDWRSVQIKDWCGAQVKGQGGVKIQRGRVHKWACCHWRNSLRGYCINIRAGFLNEYAKIFAPFLKKAAFQLAPYACYIGIH